ncbi:MAG: uroporphyrinogen decarboxylase family protein [Planctomycetota bacterium]
MSEDPARGTYRRRVLEALARREPDRVPHHVGLTEPARRKLTEYLETEDLDGALGNHLAIYSLRRMAPEELLGPGRFRDEFGVVWNRSVDPDIGVPENRVLKKPSLEGYAFPDPRDPRRYERLRTFLASSRDRFRIATVGFALFERAWSLRGMAEVLADMLEAPAFVDELLDAIVAFDLGILEELARHDFDAVLFGDDWGTQRGVIMGPKLWRRFLKPRLEVLFSAARRAGKTVFVHSCGKVQELFPDLIEIGLEVFNPLQPEVMDPFEMKRRFGDRLCFYGGMSVQRILPRGTPAEVRDAARRLRDELGRGGGYIASPSHDVPGDVPVENVLAFVEALQEG